MNFTISSSLKDPHFFFFFFQTFFFLRTGKISLKFTREKWREKKMSYFTICVVHSSCNLNTFIKITIWFQLQTLQTVIILNSKIEKNWIWMTQKIIVLKSQVHIFNWPILNWTKIYFKWISLSIVKSLSHEKLFNNNTWLDSMVSNDRFLIMQMMMILD